MKFQKPKQNVNRNKYEYNVMGQLLKLLFTRGFEVCSFLDSMGIHSVRNPGISLYANNTIKKRSEKKKPKMLKIESWDLGVRVQVMIIILRVHREDIIDCHGGDWIQRPEKKKKMSAFFSPEHDGQDTF